MTPLQITGCILAGFALIWTPGTLIGGYILVKAIRIRRANVVAARVEWAREGEGEGCVLTRASQIVEDELRKVMREVEWG